MLSECTAEDLTEQIELYALDPWGEGREDFRMAMMASKICNHLGGRTTITDFIIDFSELSGTPAPPPSPHDTVRQLIAAGFPVVIKQRD